MTEGEAQSTPSMPVWQPQVGACYGNGWERMWKHFLELLLIFIVYFLLILPGAIPYVGWVYSFLVSGPLAYGVAYALLRAARGEPVKIDNMFAAFSNYWNAVLAYLLTAVIVIIGIILLIVPGIIFACRLAFTPYLIVERKMEAIEAIKTSWRMTRGHAGTVFLVGLLGIPIAIAGMICLGVGLIPASMWIGLALASLYHSVASQEQNVIKESSVHPS